MGLLHLLVAALAAAAAMAADAPCAPVNPDQKIDPISNPMIFFQQPTLGGVSNGVACAMDATLTAHAYDEANDGLVIQILTNSLGTAKITVVDGPRTFVISKNTVQGDITWKSTGGVLVFNFEGASASPPGVFMIVVQKSQSGRDPLPSVIPTTQAPVTAPYDPKYNGNPLLVANDIMIAVDISSDDVEAFKSFATDLVTALTITNATDCGVGTRLALYGVTSFNGFTSTYLPDWLYVKESALGNIASMSKIGSGPFYIKPVVDLVNNGFKDDQGIKKDEPDRCLNRGRQFILFTSSQPAEYTPLNPLTNDNTIVDFIGRGVHPIIVTSLRNGSRDYYDQYTKKPDGSNGYNRWSYFNIDDGVTAFINNYLVDTNTDLSCQLPKDSTVLLTKDVKTDAPAKVSIPPYYEGMITGQDDDFTAWDTIKHYCNFQSTTVTIEQTTKDTDLTKLSDVCIRVYYDLETDRDFVSIYSGDYASGNLKQVVKLTGRDVSGSTFRLGNTYGYISFSSDEKNVYDGFYAEIYPCGAAVKD